VVYRGAHSRGSVADRPMIDSRRRDILTNGWCGAIMTLKRVTSMRKTIRVVFDGEVLRPQEPVDLEPDTAYTITIQPEVQEQPVPEASEDEEYPLTVIARLATDMGVTDLAERHDYYANRRIRDTLDEQ